MFYHYIIAMIISTIIFTLISLIKRKKYLWIFLFSLGLLPFIAMLSGTIYSIFNGSGLVGDYGGLDSGLFAIVLMLVFQWYIFIPALILLCFSIYKLFIKKEI